MICNYIARSKRVREACRKKEEEKKGVWKWREKECESYVINTLYSEYSVSKMNIPLGVRKTYLSSFALHDRSNEKSDIDCPSPIPLKESRVISFVSSSSSTVEQSSHKRSQDLRCELSQSTENNRPNAVSESLIPLSFLCPLF